jgi:hypothetical protein
VKLATNARSSSSAVPLCPSPGGFVDGDEQVAGVDVFVASGSATSEQLVIVHDTLERRNEEPVDRDAEGPDDLVEDVEGGVGGAAFDIGDGLTRDAGGFGEGSLRESSSGSGDDEVRLRISLKGGRDVGAFGDMTAPFGG